MLSDTPGDDPRPTGPADLIDEVTPELLLCTALVRSGKVDGCGASLMTDANSRVPLAATDSVFQAAAELQFSVWEGAGPDVVDFGQPVPRAGRASREPPLAADHAASR